jgi:hypothetical protein
VSCRDLQFRVLRLKEHLRSFYYAVFHVEELRNICAACIAESPSGSIGAKEHGLEYVILKLKKDMHGLTSTTLR